MLKKDIKCVSLILSALICVNSGSGCLATSADSASLRAPESQNKVEKSNKKWWAIPASIVGGVGSMAMAVWYFLAGGKKSNESGSASGQASDLGQKQKPEPKPKPKPKPEPEPKPEPKPKPKPKPKQQKPEQEKPEQEKPEQEKPEQEKPKQQKPKQQKPKQQKPKQQKPKQQKPKQQKPKQQKPKQQKPEQEKPEQEKPNTGGVNGKCNRFSDVPQGQWNSREVQGVRKDRFNIVQEYIDRYCNHERGFSKVFEREQDTEHYGLPSYRHEETLFFAPVNTLRAVQALPDGYKEGIAILNMANFYTPGGGVANGAYAQEEYLCHYTGLYPPLYECDKEFYEKNRLDLLARHNKHAGQPCEYKDFRDFKVIQTVDDLKNCPEQDKGIYVYNVKQVREDDGDECSINWIPEGARPNYDVICVAAPKIGLGLRSCKQAHKHGSDCVLEWNSDEAKQAYYEVMLNQARMIVQEARKHYVKVLVLGALGCGAFNGDPEVVASAFYQVLIEEGTIKCFDAVVFPILVREGNAVEQKNYDTFVEQFKSQSCKSWNSASNSFED